MAEVFCSMSELNDTQHLSGLKLIRTLNGKPVTMAEVFLSMSELNVTQHLSGL